MRQEPQRESPALLIQNRMRRLSSREQLEILLKAMRSLPNKNRVEILSATGLHFVRYKAIDIVLRFLLKNLMRGIVWSVFYGVLIIVGLILLAFFDAYPLSFPSLIAALIAYFIGFFVFTAVEFSGDILPFILRKTTPDERTQLAMDIEALDSQEKISVLRATGIRIFRRGPGDSVITTLLTGVILALVGVLMVVMVLWLSVLVSDNVNDQIAGYFPIVVGIGAFLLGYLVPRQVQRRAGSLLRKGRLVAQDD